jgi:hypothetical protein
MRGCAAAEPESGAFRLGREALALLCRSRRDIAPFAQPASLKAGALSGSLQSSLSYCVDPGGTCPPLCNRAGRKAAKPCIGRQSASRSMISYLRAPAEARKLWKWTYDGDHTPLSA